MRDKVAPGGRAEWEARVAGTVRGRRSDPREGVMSEAEQDPKIVGDEPSGGFTPRPGSEVDGGWRPDEFPHGEPEPGPSVEDDPAARGPAERSSLPKNPPVPPEAGEQSDPDDPGDGDGS